MDSEFDKNQNMNSGLLRFRSAPSSLFENLTDGVIKIENFGSENKGFNLAGLNNQLVSQNSQLPPQYPRQNTSANVGSTDGGGYRVMGSLGNNNLERQNKLASNLMRQNSSPAGLFSHLNSQIGIYCFIFLLFMHSFFIFLL